MGWLGDFVERLADFDVEMNKLVVQSGARSEGCGAARMGDRIKGGVQIWNVG